jgi:hypothetical protein
MLLSKLKIEIEIEIVEDLSTKFNSERHEMLDCKLPQLFYFRCPSAALIIYRHTCAIVIIPAQKPAPMSNSKAILLSVFPEQPLFDDVAVLIYPAHPRRFFPNPTRTHVTFISYLCTLELWNPSGKMTSA